MQVKNRLFPYPVINHAKLLSDYGNFEFVLSYDQLIDELNEYVIKNASFKTDSTTINTLFQENDIGVSLIVECSDTVYRKAFELTQKGKDIILPKSDFSEKVEISMFAFAKKPFIYKSAEADDDYKGLTFDIEKYDIIGAYDGFSVRFKHEDKETDLVQSIFSVNVDHNMESGPFRVECDIGRKIAISLSEKDYQNYKIIYTVPINKEIFFNMLLVPALIEGLTLCKKVLTDDETNDMEDIGNQYLWFRSILSAYKKQNGIELTTDIFEKTSPLDLAQNLLGNPSGKALENLVNNMNGNLEGDD